MSIAFYVRVSTKRKRRARPLSSSSSASGRTRRPGLGRGRAARVYRDEGQSGATSTGRGSTGCGTWRRWPTSTGARDRAGPAGAQLRPPDAPARRVRPRAAAASSSSTGRWATTRTTGSCCRSAARSPSTSARSSPTACAGAGSTSYRAGALLPWTKRALRLPVRPRAAARSRRGARRPGRGGGGARALRALPGAGGSLCRAGQGATGGGYPPPRGKRRWSSARCARSCATPPTPAGLRPTRAAPGGARRSALTPVGQPQPSRSRPPEEWIPVAAHPGRGQPGAVRPGAGQAGPEPDLRRAQQPRPPLPAARAGQLRAVPAACTRRIPAAGYSYYACAGKAPAGAAR